MIIELPSTKNFHKFLEFLFKRVEPLQIKRVQIIKRLY